MIYLKSAEHIELMRVAGRITAEALIKAGEAVAPGVSTKHIDDVVRDYIEKCGAKPTFLGYGGFPGSACVSVNDEIIHGIPSKDKILEEGDIVKVDVGAFYRGFNGDSARTFPVGKISEEAQRLIDITRECFEKGAEQVTLGNRLGDVGAAVQEHAESHGYSVVRDFVGHGVGEKLHEDPEVPNYGKRGRGQRLSVGMTIAIEPMINIGGYEIDDSDENGWTVRTADGSLSAHYENTVALTENGMEILTKA